jgi:hypothetical protein
MAFGLEMNEIDFPLKILLAFPQAHLCAKKPTCGSAILLPMN